MMTLTPTTVLVQQATMAPIAKQVYFTLVSQCAALAVLFTNILSHD